MDFDKIAVITPDDALVDEVELFLAVKGFVRHYRIFNHLRRTWETMFVRKKF